jgi:hypothetical protein
MVQLPMQRIFSINRHGSPYCACLTSTMDENKRNLLFDATTRHELLHIHLPRHDLVPFSRLIVDVFAPNIEICSASWSLQHCCLFRAFSPEGSFMDSIEEGPEQGRSWRMKFGEAVFGSRVRDSKIDFKFHDMVRVFSRIPYSRRQYVI